METSTNIMSIRKVLGGAQPTKEQAEASLRVHSVRERTLKASIEDLASRTGGFDRAKMNKLIAQHGDVSTAIGLFEAYIEAHSRRGSLT